MFSTPVKQRNKLKPMNIEEIKRFFESEVDKDLALMKKEMEGMIPLSVNQQEFGQTVDDLIVSMYYEIRPFERLLVDVVVKLTGVPEMKKFFHMQQHKREELFWELRNKAEELYKLKKENAEDSVAAI